MITISGESPIKDLVSNLNNLTPTSLLKHSVPSCGLNLSQLNRKLNPALLTKEQVSHSLNKFQGLMKILLLQRLNNMFKDL